MLKRLSPHRLRDEIVLILKEAFVIKYLLRMEKLVSLDFIDRRLKLNRANLGYLAAIKEEINWFNHNFPLRGDLDIWLIYFAGLLSSLNKSQINQICTRFGLSGGQMKRIVSCNKFSSRKASQLNKKNIRPSQIYRNLERLSFETILLIKAKYRNKFLNLHIEEFFKYYNHTQPCISGKDLTKLGLKPGPDYKKILTRLLYLQLDGRINSRRDALKWIARLRS